MSGWTNATEADVLNWWFANVSIPTARTPTHVGLVTSATAPAEDGTIGSEVSGGAYARQAYARNATNWPAASGGAPSTIDNGVAITFTEATASWGTVAYWGYFDGASAGTLCAFGAISPTKVIDSGDTAEFAVGGIVFKLGDPADSY